MATTVLLSFTKSKPVRKKIESCERFSEKKKCALRRHLDEPIISKISGTLLLIAYVEFGETIFRPFLS